MSLKALAVAALQQCAPRTKDRTLQENAPAHYPAETEDARTLQNTNDATAFWQTLTARIDRCDRLINDLCDLRNDPDEHRAALLNQRTKIAPEKLDSDIAYLKNEINRITKEAP